MQHAGPNARRAGVGLLHVASETAALSTGGGVGGRCWGCGECCCGDNGDDDGELAVLRGCCAAGWLRRAGASAA